VQSWFSFFLNLLRLIQHVKTTSIRATQAMALRITNKIAALSIVEGCTAPAGEAAPEYPVVSVAGAPFDAVVGVARLSVISVGTVFCKDSVYVPGNQVSAAIL